MRSVGVITGAGVSSESGIRTYRGPGGLYDDPAEGERTVEALSGATLRRDPDRTWRALAGLARQAAAARPGPAHYALVAIEHRVERFVLLTQNVDELHQTAGSRNVIPIHGNVRDARCSACGRRRRLDSTELAALDVAPRCRTCGAVLRPCAVLFGELLPEDEARRMREELFARSPDLVIVAGTSAIFPYIAEPVVLARRRGQLTVEINPEATSLTPIVDIVLRGPAGSWLPRISRALPAHEPRRARDAYGRPSPGGSIEPRAAPEPLSIDEGLRRGAACFDAQRFFEAHEIFERVWKLPQVAAAERPFWRAVTQVSVGCCHLQRGNPEGAIAVLDRARRTLETSPAGHPRVDRAALVELARGIAAAARRDPQDVRFARFPLR